MSVFFPLPFFVPLSSLLLCACIRDVSCARIECRARYVAQALVMRRDFAADGVRRYGPPRPGRLPRPP